MSQSDAKQRLSAYDAFDALFDDETLAELTRNDELTERLAQIVGDGLDMIEALMVDGEPDMQLAAVVKILPLAVKVLDKRQNATLDRIADELRRMFAEVFPAAEDAVATFDALIADELDAGS